MYKIILTLTFREPGSKDFAMTTTVLEFGRAIDADVALAYIEVRYPLHAIYATAVKLY